MKKTAGSYSKWGYICIFPFLAGYCIFSLVPLIMTVVNSFFENYRQGLLQIGPTFVGLDNFIDVLSGSDIWVYLKNTMIMWIMGFVPQIVVSLVLASWFADPQLRLKFTGFFKTVIYLPNLIMASAFAFFFFSVFANSGPINDILLELHIISEPFQFFSNVTATRTIIAFLNFLMWFGNTTLLLMAGIMNIDTSLFEAAQMDGATATDIFFRITLPILKPIVIYVMITSLIGGLQLFDVPQILTNGSGDPIRSSMTLLMYLNRHLFSKNYGVAGAVSVLIFIVTGVLSLGIFKATEEKEG